MVLLFIFSFKPFASSCIMHFNLLLSTFKYHYTTVHTVKWSYKCFLLLFSNNHFIILSHIHYKAHCTIAFLLKTQLSRDFSFRQVYFWLSTPLLLLEVLSHFLYTGFSFMFWQFFHRSFFPKCESNKLFLLANVWLQFCFGNSYLYRYVILYAFVLFWSVFCTLKILLVWFPACLLLYENSACGKSMYHFQMVSPTFLNSWAIYKWTQCAYLLAMIVQLII